METTTQQKCSATDIKEGSVWSRHSFGRVTRAGWNNIEVRNEQGLTWTISRNILEKEFSFADQHETTEKLSRTQLIEKVISYPFTAMTIVFNKKPVAKDIAETLRNGQGNLSDRAWTRHVSALMKGEPRTMIGHHRGQFDEHRRLRFSESGKGPRLVDPRTIQSVIVDRVRYEVKK